MFQFKKDKTTTTQLYRRPFTEKDVFQTGHTWIHKKNTAMKSIEMGKGNAI